MPNTISAEFRGEKRIVEPLIAYIREAEEELCLMRKGEAAMILGEIGDRRAVEPLLEYLEKRADDEYGEIEEIIATLGKLGDEQAIPLLQEIVEDPRLAIDRGRELSEKRAEHMKEWAQEAIKMIQKT